MVEVISERARLFDVIIYAASGFTGREVTKYFYKHAGSDLKWAISGRSQSKLGALKAELLAMNNNVSSSSSSSSGSNSKGSSSSSKAASAPSPLPPARLPDILVAEIDDKRTLVAMFSEARLVLNCVGPYRFFGKQVVEACLEAGSDYLDLCGEPQFMEQCFLDYHTQAVEKDVLIVHACAFDSVPADLGSIFTMRQFPPQRCCSVESFLQIRCPEGLKAHYTTFESAVHGVADAHTLKQVRKEVEKKFSPPPIIHAGPRLTRSTGYYYEKRINKYALPFMGADASVVGSSQRSLAMRTGQHVWPQYAAYVLLNSFYWVATASFYGGIFSTLAKFEMGRSLLLSCPEALTSGVFSHEGPSEAQLQRTTFEMHFFAEGYSTPLASASSSSSSSSSHSDLNDADDVPEAKSDSSASAAATAVVVVATGESSSEESTAAVEAAAAAATTTTTTTTKEGEEHRQEDGEAVKAQAQAVVVPEYDDGALAKEAKEASKKSSGSKHHHHHHHHHGTREIIPLSDVSGTSVGVFSCAAPWSTASAKPVAAPAAPDVRVHTIVSGPEPGKIFVICV